MKDFFDCFESSAQYSEPTHQQGQVNFPEEVALKTNLKDEQFPR